MAEKEAAATVGNVPAASGTSTPPGHAHHRGRRLQKLLHPSGKIFHIVRSHSEIEEKRNEVLQQTPRHEDFEIVVHGTEEHISAVRDCHTHHAKSRDALYQNNTDLLARYENVRSELDALSTELHMLTDHAVSLDASFDKFGYSATLRTLGDSETASLEDSHDASKHQDRTLTAMKFFKAPVIRQYFHKGLIWRSPQSGEVVSFELFVDLVYVAVIDAIGEVAASNASAASFLHYIIVFAIASKVFNDILTVMNWFEINDVISRLCNLFILICLYAFASNTEYFFESTYTAGLSFYLASRFFVMLWFVFTSYAVPMVRPVLIYHAIVALLAATIWIGSIHVEYPRNLPLIFVAIFVDLVASQWYFAITTYISHLNKRMKIKALNSLVEYVPAMNIEHRVERSGAFVSLVIGYSVIKIFFQSHAEYPLNAFLGKGILGLIQAFVFNWIYFEIDAWGIHVHAIRRHWLSTGIWNLMHVIFSASFILAASTMAELVIAHDCSDANPEDLAEAYAASSLEELEPALRWFYCGGLGVALISMAAISLSHRHKQFPGAKLRKPRRLLYRVAIAIVIICLPLAHDLSSLDLITITTCLITSSLMVDIFGLSCSGDGFFRDGFCPKRKKQTRYTAQCRVTQRKKREMLEKVQRGENVGLDQVLARDGSVSSFGSGETRFDENADKGAGNC